MNMFKVSTFNAIESGGDVAGNVGVCVVTSLTITSLHNANNQQFQTARSGSNFPALVFWWIFLSQVREIIFVYCACDLPTAKLLVNFRISGIDLKTLGRVQRRKYDTIVII